MSPTKIRIRLTFNDVSVMHALIATLDPESYEHPESRRVIQEARKARTEIERAPDQTVIQYQIVRDGTWT